MRLKCYSSGLKARKFLEWEKLENMIKKQCFEKETIPSFKKHLYQNGKAENMPVVAGRFVFTTL